MHTDLFTHSVSHSGEAQLLNVPIKNDMQSECFFVMGKSTEFQRSTVTESQHVSSKPPKR